ncbi:hypothetical protein Syun_012879 [Stephania yunnanensis]|uniref:Sec1 family domain-containing protein MIP3 n=1 Tax=Stephania yunnanensis TaxID=152371 RepID=A0AAP0K103_9MAGN
MASVDVIKSCLESLHQVIFFDRNTYGKSIELVDTISILLASKRQNGFGTTYCTNLKFSHLPFLQYLNISEHLADSILYLDAGCTEAFQYLGAFPLLLELGVRSVCSLESNCPLDKVVDWSPHVSHAQKMVVITSRLLSDAHRYILRCLSAQQTVLRCAIFTSISEMAHSAYTDSPLGPDAYREYESLLLQDFEECVGKGRVKGHSSSDQGESSKLEKSNFSESLASEEEGWSLNPTEEDTTHYEGSFSGRGADQANSNFKKDGLWPVVSIHHFPMVLCPLSPKVFVLPSEGTVAEACLSIGQSHSISQGLPPISTGMTFDEDTPPGATLTAHFLYHLAAKMDLKVEIFSLGDLSKTIGKMLMDMSSLYDVGRRKRSAGLLLIDRTLDLLTPCCHGDTLVDRMFSSLARKERTSPFHLIQNHQGVSSLQVPPLLVQIPLENSLSMKDTATDDCLLMERIEAFQNGWNSFDLDSELNWTDLQCRISSENHVISDEGLLFGSFVSTDNYQGTKYMEALLDRRMKEGALLIKKWLEEVLRREKISTNVGMRAGSVRAAELRTMVSALSKDQSCIMRNKGIIQLASAAALALGEPNSSRWDAFLSAERILRVSAAGDTSQSLSAQIRDLINKSISVNFHDQNLKSESSQGLLSFQDALLLAITGYILAGENLPTSGSGSPFSWEEEHLLKESILDAILDNPGAAKLKFLHGLEKELEANLDKINSKKCNEDSLDESAVGDFDDDQWGDWGDEETNQNNEKEYSDMQLKLELRDRIDSLFKFFHKLSTLKRRNVASKEGSFGVESNFDVDTYMGRGLLYKVLTMILAKYEVSGLEYHSSTVGRLFKSGFGRFGLGQAKPSLSDHNVILIFVVGGINGLEVFEAQEALSQSGRPDIELIIGGTTVLTPEYMFDLLLGSSSYI